MSAAGRFGRFGGRPVAETLVPALDELDEAYRTIGRSASFKKELDDLLRQYCGRPTPLYFARRLSPKVGLRVYLKREDLLHTGAHKINNAIGQVLLADRMGKKKIIAETGAGQHGVATATAAALFGKPCEVFMGSQDMIRQAPNVARMRLLGATVRPVDVGSATLKDAMNEALRHWITHVKDTHYVIGSAAGPHPYPTMVRNFQSVIGREARRQIRQQTGRLPHAVLACVGGGSNAIGIFHAFVKDAKVRLIGLEAAGSGIRSGKHSASLTAGRFGIFHGMRTLILQNADGQIETAHSVAAGLDYPGVGPEHAHLKESGRATYWTINDERALAAFEELSQLEGIIPALESAHALAGLKKAKRVLPKNAIVVVNLSGRGDKDLDNYANARK